MQQYVPCIGCNSQLPIPETTEDGSSPTLIRCDNCGQEFFWNDSFANVESPLLELEPESQDLDSKELEPPELGSPELDSQLAYEAELVESESSNEEASYSTSENTAEDNLDWGLLGAATQPRRRKEASALRKIVPPLLGGLAAFPIATLIMWYGFGRDIGTTGAMVAQYAPWIVPERFRDLPADFAGRDSRRTSSVPRQLPNINRPESDESLVQTPSIPRQMENEADSMNPKSTSEAETTETTSEQAIQEETQSLSRTIAKLQTLQEDWSSTPKDNRAMQVMMIGRYCIEIKRLAQMSAELKGRSGAVWWKEIESRVRDIVSHQNLPTVIQYSATGKWPEVPAALPGEFLATMLKISDDNAPDPNAQWLLREKWRYGDKDLKVEVQPGAWRKGNATSPGSGALVFGKLVQVQEGDAQGELVLKAHAIFLP